MRSVVGGPLGTLAMCTFQAARRGRRGEGASVSGVSRLRVLDAVLAGGRPLRVQDGVFYRLSFGFDR